MSRLVVVSRLIGILLVATLLGLGACDGEIGGPVGPESGAPFPDTPLRANGFIFLPPVCDDAGANDVPEQSDLNCFSRADNVSGRLGVEWSWDDTDVWTGTGQTGDACGLFDTDGDGNANLAVCAQFTNNADGSAVIQLPETGAAIAYECSDKKDDRCSKQVRLLTATELGTTECTVTPGLETAPWQGDDYPNDVVAQCDLDLGALPNATNTNLLNVCSYPSGEPNSNPFDCVITPGAGYVVIQKATTPESTQSFSFSLNPSARDGTTSFTVAGSDGSGGPGSSGLIAVAPGTYAITETIPSGWSLDAASCTNDNGTFTSPAVSGISVAAGQTVTCTFENSLPPGITVLKTATPNTVPETGGNVTYEVVTTNTSGAAVTLNTLSDDVFGNVAPAEGETNAAIVSSTCTLPQTLAATGQEGASYTCSFVAALAKTTDSDEHVNELTASASSAAGTATASDTAKVTFGEVLPQISVTKTADPTSVDETGGDVTFTVLVTNLTAEAASLTKLEDNVFGNIADGTNSKLTSTSCSVPQALGPTDPDGDGDEYECAFTVRISGTPGQDHVNEVTATASDDDGNETTAKDDATVGIGAVDPTIKVTKTASPTSVPETGGSVTYTVAVENTSLETITISSLVDDKFGDLNGKNDCAVPQTLQPRGDTGDSWSCSFTEAISGDTQAGPHTNRVTASGQDDDGQSVEGSDDATVTFDDVKPDISVTKTANPTQVLETGGEVTFTVLVTNNAAEEATLTSLTDDKFGDLNGEGTCALSSGSPSLAASGGTYSCSFKKTLASLDLSSHVNTVTAIAADNEGNTDTATDDATVTFEDVLPDISVTKTASPTEVPETGGTVEFTVTVTNNSLEPVAITSLSDDKFGDLDGQGDCAITPTAPSLAPTGDPGSSYTCKFSKSLSNGSGDHVNTVTAVGTDSEGNTDSASDDATVTFSDVLPQISVTKTASPTSVEETGGSVTYSVSVTNTGDEAVTLDGLTDDKFGDLNGKGDCATGASLASGSSYDCAFTETVSGNSGESHVNTVTATASDNDDNSVEARDDATVTFTDVLPDITVTKTVSPETLGGTSATLVGPPPPLEPVITSSTDPLYVLPVYDVDGVNDVPEQSDLNWFTRADNLAGELWVKWAWDDTDQWTGTGQTGDACGLFDTNGNGFADLAVCAQITNDPATLDVVQLPSDGAATAYACSDKKADRCSKQVTLLTSIGSTTCTISVDPEPLSGAPWSGDDGYDVVAECGLDLVPLGAGSGAKLLNVCSFPSGEPNSNPFDCIVTPGAGFLLVEKDATPATSQNFGFTLSPAAANGTTSFSVTGGGTSALIPVMPGQYSVTESSVANWTVSSATCSDGTNLTGTYNGTDAITGIQVDTGETVTCGFSNVWGLSAPVTYTIVVANNSLEAATLESLNDDIFGDLNGEGSCSLTQSLAPTGQTGASYTCSFMKTLSGGAGTTHTNVVTATASDDEGTTVTDTDDATVTFTGP